MDRKQQVFVKLKLKAKALGFNQKELKGIAAKIADNLKSEEDASDEDVDAEIDEKIEAALPLLTISQSQANRLLDEWKKNHTETDDDDDDDPSNQNRNTGSKNKNPNNKGKDDEEPAWFKAYREQQDARFAAIEADKTTSSRKAKLEALLKDTGTFGSRTLKSFGKMKFESDEEFDEFFSEVEEDLKSYNQERANAGLASMGAPAAGGQGGKEEKLLTDAEVAAIAGDYC